MKKTGQQIEGDIYDFLKDTELSAMISGGVYREEYRPKDSRNEDAVVIFTGGFTRQVQSGVVTVNVYVPDKESPDGNGLLVKDGLRAEELEAACQRWVDSLPMRRSCYKFRLSQTIYTEEEPEIHQHFVVVKLEYEYFDGEASTARKELIEK